MRAADQHARAARRPARGCESPCARAPRRRALRAQAQPLGAAADIPRQIRPRAGAATTPATGAPSSISAILTVNSSRPARNSRVPSSGSTRKKRSPRSADRAGCRSLLRHHRTPGRSRASPSRITASAASSARSPATVGLVALPPGRGRGTARIAAAAREAIKRQAVEQLATISEFRPSQCPRFTPRSSAAIYHIARSRSTPESPKRAVCA